MDFLVQVGLEWGFDDLLMDFGIGLCQCMYVIDVQVFKVLGNVGGQGWVVIGVVFQEIMESLCSCGEIVWYVYIGVG